MISTPAKSEDAVEVIINQWLREGFNEDELVAMETIGRLKRLETILMRQLNKNYKKIFNLNQWEFDVLATLRRSGKPYRLSPTSLFDSMMVSSGTMTNRLQNLEKKQLIIRVENHDDKRSMLVELSPKGVELIDQVMISHVQLENELLSDMSREELDIVNTLLKKIERQIST